MTPWPAARSGAFALATLWLLGAAGAILSGWSHGFVPSRADGAPLPYEWRGVLFECAVMAVESLALYGLLFRLRRGGRLRRTLAAVVLFLALAAYGILTVVTDMPGWYYVNTLWTLFLLLVLATAFATQALARLALRLRARRA